MLAWLRLSCRVGQSTHENDVPIFFDDEQERMARVELDLLDVGRDVLQIVVGDAGTCSVEHSRELVVCEENKIEKSQKPNDSERIVVRRED